MEPFGNRGAASLAIAALVAACGGGDGGAADVDFAVVDTDVFSGISAPRTAVVRDAAAWSALWAEHKREARLPAPTIDFSQHLVVGVFLGQRSSGCHGVAISGVVQSARMITVQYQETVPGPDALCAAVLVFPSQIAALPASNLPVEFVALASRSRP